MTTFKRKNAWNQNGSFDNPDLLWYAKAVGVMQSRQLSDPKSWWFFAAIHGEDIAGGSIPGWKYFPVPPNVPTTPLASLQDQETFWNQCQHQSWYFPPWHRGYLIALEDQLRTIVISLGGPADWALPYWNYFGPQSQFKIPPAFMQQKLPDGSTNPLYVKARYGPKNNGIVYVDTTKVSQDCQTNTLYTGSNANTKRPGYGGPKTEFHHNGGISGNLEADPHNIVHGQVGGNGGMMSYPDSAALDPIFYLHHCNIDRLWASWNNAGNANPDDQNWLQGPAASGERKFIMPMPDGTSWTYTPDDVKSLSQLNYSYDDLQTGISPLIVNTLSKRLINLGVKSIDSSKNDIMNFGTDLELVGANEDQLHLTGSGGHTTVKFNSSPLNKVSKSLMNASEANLPDQVHLQLENVKGVNDANTLAVSINHQLAGHISLFGLRNASKADGHNAGVGMTFILNITDIIDNMHLNNGLDIDTLDVTIIPDNSIDENEKITVGRVSIYREPQQSEL